MPLKIIGAGFGRTGTLSLKYALEQLGFGRCYHMTETLEHPEHDRKWLALARGESTDWRGILDHYSSTVDWPSVMLWKELISACPNSKVILTMRDPVDWYQSAQDTIFARMREFAAVLASADADRIDTVRREHMLMVNAVVVERTFGGNLDKARAIEVFNAHNNEVKRVVPRERLLVHESCQGWEPLCAFLGVPPPASAPYPRVNTTEEFLSRSDSLINREHP
jgi:hypothetical protein